MCATCGCGGGEHEPDAFVEHAHEHEHVDAGGRRVRHVHAAAGAHEHEHEGRAAPEARDARIVRVERELLEKNDAIAAITRARLAATRTLALNLVSSPGAGKTALLVRTLRDLAGRLPVAVIEGDQRTSLDADRIRATGAPAWQIETGAACHLDAAMIARALERFAPPPHGVLFVENVGNLVCPAAFDLGDAGKIVLVSVAEGDDKPLKYAPTFRAARLVVVTKLDLAPHVDCDLAALAENVRRVNARAEVLRLSARTGEGLAAWYAWLEARLAEAKGA